MRMHKASGARRTIVAPAIAGSPAPSRAKAIAAARPMSVEDKRFKAIADAKALKYRVLAAIKAAEEINVFIGDAIANDRANGSTNWDGPSERRVRTILPSAPFHVMTSANFRMITLHKGHHLSLISVRHSAKGGLLFGFEPSMNPELEKRQATLVEIPHEQLGVTLERPFSEWLTNGLGATPEEMIIQAAAGLTADDVAGLVITPEPEVKTDPTDSIPEWGAWA